MRPLYRVRQFLLALSPRTGPETEAAVAEVLTPAEAELFRRMPRYDQQHGILVLSRLRQPHAAIAPDLARAALLHDVGKSVDGSVRLWHRVALVLARSLAPRLLRDASRAEPGDWRYPVRAIMDHAERGAEMLRASGAAERVVELVRRHHDVLTETEEDDWLRALQAADHNS